MTSRFHAIEACSAGYEALHGALLSDNRKTRLGTSAPMRAEEDQRYVIGQVARLQSNRVDERDSSGIQARIAGDLRDALSRCVFDETVRCRQ